MEVIGKSKAKIVIESCLHESSRYFSDHTKIVRCNPYCTNVIHLSELGIYQWVFQVNDPRNNPITAIFFVEQHEETTDHYGAQNLAGNGRETHKDSRCIQWINASKTPELKIDNNHTFVGKANTRICLYHLDNNKTEVHFETDISLDFQLSFPLNMMPEGILKFMSETIMSQIMQQATESMLCQVQSDICCTTAELAIEGGKK
ncbi:MAG: DUF1997 domain-containing protein [Chlorobiaceae bacterium]|jgi:hypothetical protein|nr:DUF1997 domain-containing protein [Chlorobiaceae bacterium]NTW62856.1 DUF1997 domain-containing protein [Chlorobiaceae bacterium]